MTQYGAKCAAYATQSLQTELARLRAEVERLRQDAERYRWLKEHASAIDLQSDPDNQVLLWSGKSGWRFHRGGSLDSAVDAAREGE